MMALVHQVSVYAVLFLVAHVFANEMEFVKEEREAAELDEVGEIVKRTKELKPSALNNALKGYDLVHGEPYIVHARDGPDPGLKLPIFKNGENVHISKITQCKTGSESHIVTSVKQFRNLTGKSSVTGSGFGFKADGEISLGLPENVSDADGTLNWEVSADVAFSGSKTTSEIAEFLITKKGAVVTEQAVCLIDQVEIADYHLPHFTKIFKQALQDLAHCARPRRSAEFKKFINHFGSHYIIKAYLGARLMKTTFVTKEARRELDNKTIKECSKNSWGFNIFGALGNKNNDKCSSDNVDKFKNGGKYVSKAMIESYGSTPRSAIDDWSNQDFDPMPIKLRLRPIIDLIEEKNLKRQGLEDIVGAGLRGWFLPLYKNYCSTMGLSCKNKRKKGCGYTDNCKVRERCVDIGSNGKVKCEEIPGEWGSWREWQSCSKTCGNGLQKRYRSCMFGKCAQGSEVESKPCSLQPCWGKTYSCEWLGGSSGETLQCPADKVAAGACGSGAGFRLEKLFVENLGHVGNCRDFNMTKLKCCKGTNSYDIPNTAATADFSQRNLPGIQSKGVDGVRLENGNFIFRWINDKYSKMVLTNNRGQTLKEGYLKYSPWNWSDEKNLSWYNVSAWFPTTANYHYSISNFRGIKGKTGCYTDSETYGKESQCHSNKFITELCGSGWWPDCGDNKYISYKCCRKPGYTITSDCKWQYGGKGEDLECPKNKIMTGYCGSAKDASCSGGYSHGIQCCTFSHQ